MSNFKVGDWVVRCIQVSTDAFNVCETGKPVKIASIDNDGWLEFSQKEGGDGWNYKYFREATPEDFEKWQVVVPSSHKTQRTLEDVKLDLAKKLEEVERLKKELEEIENTPISVSIPKKQMGDFVKCWDKYVTMHSENRNIYNIFKKSLEQHNATSAR